MADAKAVISGTGISRIGRRTGIAAIELTEQAAAAAISDAGLTPADIDDVISLGDTPTAQAAARLGIAQVSDRPVSFGPRGLLEPVAAACEAVTTGGARHVLVYRTVQMIGGTVGSEDPPKSGDGPNPMADSEIGHLLAAHAYSAANWLAMHCRKHMDLYGTTKEQLGWVAINARRNAGRNPLAVYQDPIGMQDYLSARPISSPFGLLDCDVPVDGSIALVISAPGYRDSPGPAVTVEAYGGAPGTGGWTRRPDYPTMAAADAAADMWSKTTLTPADVDVAELYDGFSFLTLSWLEALGFCATGEGGPFVEGGQRIAIDGELPLNTYGGQLSAGRMHGYWVLHEACRQLRGSAGPTALPKRPEVAVVSAGGGPIAGCVLLTC